MRRLAAISLIAFILPYCKGQNLSSFSQNFLSASDSTRKIELEDDFSYNKKKVLAVAGFNIAGYGAALYGLNEAWYKQYPRSSFHFFNDWHEWMQMDKFGHVFSAYAESKASMELWRWSGIERKKRIWIGGMSGAAYQTVIEILDGYCSAWGWSWGDMGANILGSGLLVAQELAWDEQRVQLKWSFRKKSYADSALDKRSDAIFGGSDMERMLKDYNGQTYWLSFPARSFINHRRIPNWLQLSVGTGVENVFGARGNLAKDGQGNIVFDGTNLRRYRQWYIAPDVDLSKIKTKRKGIRMLLNMVNVIKFPAPALSYGNGKFSVCWLAF